MKGSEIAGWVAVIPIVIVAACVVAFGIACIAFICYLFGTAASAVFTG